MKINDGDWCQLEYQLEVHSSKTTVPAEQNHNLGVGTPKPTT